MGFLHGHAGASAGVLRTKAPCPEWWETEMPSWEPEVLQVTCPHPPQAPLWFLPAGGVLRQPGTVAVPARSVSVPSKPIRIVPQVQPELPVTERDLKPDPSRNQDNAQALLREPSRRSLTEL